MKTVHATLGFLCAVVFALMPGFAGAYNSTAQYWCGWGWSSTPCVSYPSNYTYGYANSYSYNYNVYPYSYNYPCAPVSIDSRGTIVQTTCGYVNAPYSYQNQYWQQPNYYPYQQHQYSQSYYGHGYGWNYQY